jgi:hypothetical protein
MEIAAEEAALPSVLEQISCYGDPPFGWGRGGPSSLPGFAPWSVT